MSKSLFFFIIVGASLVSAQQVGVSREQQQQYANERAAKDKRDGYLRTQANAMQTYRNCMEAQQQIKNPNPHNCDQFRNDADYWGKMAAAVVIPANPLRGSVTGQPLPPAGATGGLGGVPAGVVYGVATGQTRFNENSQTISGEPVVTYRRNNTRIRAFGQSNIPTAPRYNVGSVVRRPVQQRLPGVNGNGYRGVPPGSFRRNRK